MADDPAFLFYPGDYLRDTQCFSEKVQVSYDRIMCEHMRNICISHKQLKFFTKRLNEEELEELMVSLKKVSGGYQIGWVSESIEKRRVYSESRRKNRSKDMKTYVPHMENENENENENEFKYLNDSKFSEIYLDYIDMRKTIRKPPTKKAEEMALTELHKHPIETAIKMLEQSVMNSWQGIFPLRTDKGKFVNNKPQSIKQTEYTHPTEQSKEDQEKVKKMISDTASKL